MVKNFFTVKGITIHYSKDIFGNYFLSGHYTSKMAPDDNIKRRIFFRPFLKNLRKLDRNNKKYPTVIALRNDIKRSLK